jgi:hypothetical protein
MKKATAATSIPVVAILTQDGLLPLKQGDNLAVRFPCQVYGFDEVTVLGTANRPADVVTLVNANVPNQAIGTIARYKRVPYTFEFTKNVAYGGVLPTFIKVNAL